MQNQLHARFLLANQTLRDFLRRAQGLPNERRAVTEEELKIISARLITLAPEVGDAARGETLDAGLQVDIAEYVKNLGALLSTLEKIRNVTQARRMHWETGKQHTDEPRIGVDLCPQTT
jgi:hypothetical protein